jgi:hypothetical protein
MTRSMNASRPPMMAMPWRWAMAALLLAMSLLSGCATSKPRTIDIPQAQLQGIVDKRFPYKARWLDAIEITAVQPKLTLPPGAGTILANIDIQAVDKIFNHGYHGNLGISSGLRYEPSDNSFRFTGVKVERFEVQGLPTAYAPETARLGTLLAQQLLENYAIFTLSPQQSETLKDAGLKVSAMRITDLGLSITLSPVLE